MVKAFLMIVGMVCLGVMAKSQVDEASLEEKYWNYRERQRLKFIKLDWRNGGGLSFAKIDRRIKCGELQGAIEGGDLGMSMGFYLGTLALEYANLLRVNKNVNPVLTEIYYAINAIGRIDENAEPFFDQSLSPTKDGFFIRQDFPLDFYKDWEAQGDPIHLIKGGSSMGAVPKLGESLDMKIIPENGKNYIWHEYISDFEDKKYVFPTQTYLNENPHSPIAWSFTQCRYTDNGVDPINGTPTGLEHKKLSLNEMSQDQVIGYLFGLAYIKEFVPNVYVKPTALDRGFYLHDEIKTLTTNWMDFMSSERTFGGTEEDKIPLNSSGSCALNYEAKSNWLLSNPINDRMVTRGSELLVFAYPMERASKRLYGAGWEQLANFDQYTTGHEIQITDFFNEGSAGILCEPAVLQAKLFLSWAASVDWDDWKTVWEGPIQEDFDNLNFKLKWSGLGLKDIMLGRVKIYLTDDNAQEYLVGELSGNSMVLQILNALAVPGLSSDMGEKVDFGELGDYIACLMCEAGLAPPGAICTSGPCTPPTSPIVENTFFSNDNVEMSLKLAIASNTWSHDNIVHWAEEQGNHWYYDIVDAVLNDRDCSYSKADYEAFLDKAPDTYITGLTSNDWDSTSDHDWYRQNMFRMSTTNSHGNSSNHMDYSGMDYLFLYNLYKYKFWDDTDKSYDPDNACMCYNTALFTRDDYEDDEYENDHLESSYQIITDESTPNRFPLYRELGYGTPDWVHNKVDVLQGGTLTVNGDLNICSKEPGVNSAQITVDENSFIELTPSPEGFPKKLKVKKNSRLLLQGGKLIVGDHSQVIIEKGGTLRVKDQNNGLPAEIVLDGDNAILQIEGSLDIADNSTFTVSGTGKVIFYSYDPDCINFGEDSEFILNGSGNEDVIAELMTPRLNFTNRNAKMVKISNGKVLLADGSRIVSGVPLDLYNVTFTKRHENDQPEGLYIKGQEDVSITLCDFSHMKRGIYASRFLRGNTLKVSYSDFHNLDFGITVDGGGLQLNSCNFYENNTGIFNVFCTLPSTITAGNIYDNDQGIFHMQNSLHLNRPNIHSQVYNGVNFQGRSLSAWCGDINYNQKGIEGMGSELVLSSKYKKRTGYVDFSMNQTGVSFTSTHLRIDEGYNDFTTLDALTTDKLGLYSHTKPSYGNSSGTYRLLMANQNVWDVGVFNYPVPQITFMGSNGHYEFKYEDPALGMLSLPMASPVSVIPFIPTCPTTTTTGKWKPRIPEEGSGRHPDENGTPTLLDPDPDGEFDSVVVDTAIVVTLRDMYDDEDSLTGRFILATQRLANILLIAPNESWEYGPDVYLDYLYDYAYLRMMEAFGYALVEEDAREQEPGLANLVIQVQNHLISQIELSTDENFAVEHKRFRLYYDKATTYWAVNDRLSAATTFTQMLPWLIGDELEMASHALCRVNYEQQVIDEVLPLSYMGEGTYPCADPVVAYEGYGNGINATSTQQSDGLQSLQGLALYPNPANNEVFVQTPFAPNAKDLQIVVYDIRGKEVISKATAHRMGEGLYTLDIAELKNGLYLVECNWEGQTLQAKLNVFHE